MTTGICSFVSLIVKIKLLALASSLILFSLPVTIKTPYFVHVSFSSTLQLINGVSSNLQKLLKYFNGTAIVAFLKIPLVAFGAGLATVFPNNLAL